MTPAARVSAAIEVLADIETRRRPAADAMKDWGLTHRFAGSGDRAAISSLVYDALRRKASSAWLMGEATPRAEAIGALKQTRGLDLEAIAALFTGEGHAPAPLSEAERERLATATLQGAPAHVAGDYPEWLAPQFEAAFGADAAEEGRALADRAPVDLRANLLKTTREKALKALAHLGAEPTPLSPVGLRIAIRPDGRGPALAAEPAYVKGLVEVQDEGSQLAALLSRGQARHAGPRPLRRRRRQDAGARRDDGQPRPDLRHRRRRPPPRADLRAPRALGRAQRPGPGAEGRRRTGSPISTGRCDLVMIDAPCTGSGAWRRNPDAKWRMRPGALEQRIKDQDETLDNAIRFVKPGGRIVYVTCSVLRAENEDRIAAFLARHDAFLPVDAATQARAAGLPPLAERASPFGPGFRLSPRTTGTDGFYVATLMRM